MTAFSELYNSIPEQLVVGLTRVVKEVPQVLYENPYGVSLPVVDPTFGYQVGFVPDAQSGHGLIHGERGEDGAIRFASVTLPLHGVVEVAERLFPDEAVQRYSATYNIPEAHAAQVLLERAAGIIAANDCITRFGGELPSPDDFAVLVNSAINRAYPPQR